MEAIKKFLQLLGVIKDRRLKKFQDGLAACAKSSPEDIQAWQDFVAYIDLLETSPDYPARKILNELISMRASDLPEKLNFFHQLLASRSDWSEILRFAELPIQFDQDIFEQLNDEFAKAKDIAEQTAIISSFFEVADPTHLEMLFLLIEGNIERLPQPEASQTRALAARERAVKTRLTELLSGDLDDTIRWWLIRTSNSAIGPAQAFLQETFKSRRDLRLQCMLLPLLLKTGFEWAERFGGHTGEEIMSMQSHMYANRISRLVDLTELPIS